MRACGTRIEKIWDISKLRPAGKGRRAPTGSMLSRRFRLLLDLLVWGHMVPLQSKIEIQNQHFVFSVLVKCTKRHDTCELSLPWLTLPPSLWLSRPVTWRGTMKVPWQRRTRTVRIYQNEKQIEEKSPFHAICEIEKWRRKNVYFLNLSPTLLLKS